MDGNVIIREEPITADLSGDTGPSSSRAGACTSGPPEVSGSEGVGARNPLEHPAHPIFDPRYLNITGDTIMGDILFSDAANLLITTGRVGIGTTSPLEKLDIKGNLRLGGNLVPDVSSTRMLGSPSQIWDTAYVNTIRMDGGRIFELDFIRSGAGSVEVGTNRIEQYFYVKTGPRRDNAIERFRITVDGNVGIGTTAPEALLHVAGQIKITGGNPGAGKVLTSDAEGLATWEVGVPDADWVIVEPDMYSGVTGNVGIGIQSPQEKLQVIGRLRLESPDMTRAVIIDQDEIQSIGSTLRINYDSAQDVSIMGDKMLIKTNGQVCIGTTEPYSHSEVHIKPVTGVSADLFLEGIGPRGVKWDVASFGEYGELVFHDHTSPNTPVALRIRPGVPETALFLREDGTFFIRRNLVVSGFKASDVNTASNSWRRLYTREGTEPRFIDEGRAKLVDGQARIDLDPTFMEVIELPDGGKVEGEYFVYLTPKGPSRGLYVAQKYADHFIVRENEGGQSEIWFVWRLSAVCKGYAGIRLQKVDAPRWAQIDKEGTQ
jgi:hypothetical protein